MRDIPRCAFLLVADVFVLAVLVVMLGGCVATPSRLQDRNGDFANHIASDVENPYA
jgi:hypothetical protein